MGWWFPAFPLLVRPQGLGSVDAYPWWQWTYKAKVPMMVWRKWPMVIVIQHLCDCGHQTRISLVFFSPPCSRFFCRGVKVKLVAKWAVFSRLGSRRRRRCDWNSLPVLVWPTDRKVKTMPEKHPQSCTLTAKKNWGNLTWKLEIPQKCFFKYFHP